MSIMYCHKHDQHFDTDEIVDCPQCEEDDDGMDYDRARDEAIIDNFLE